MKHNISYQRLYKFLTKNGFHLDRKKGSHEVWKNENKSLTIARKNGRDVCAPMIRRLFKELNLDIEGL